MLLASPSERYDALIADGSLSRDPAQIALLPAFDALHLQLEKQNRAVRTWGKLSRFFQASVKGLYLWGGVGTGKTCLMDIFFESLSFPQKKRVHFHAFMQEVHNALHDLQGKADPLAVVANSLASEYRVLCFDEFAVHDITDAMLLGRLFSALFSVGVCLLATSNVAPEDLYRGGLQRDLFLRAIDEITTHTQVIQIESKMDHRLLHLREAGVYYTPLTSQAVRDLENAYAYFSNNAAIEPQALLLCDRKVMVRARSQTVVWFDFLTLCATPRAKPDYLALAQYFKVVLVSDVPILAERAYDLTTNFIHLVDILYDNRLKLVLSAAAPPQGLCPTSSLRSLFARTVSRLIEMQSEDYLRSIE